MTSYRQKNVVFTYSSLVCPKFDKVNFQSMVCNVSQSYAQRLTPGQRELVKIKVKVTD